MPCEWIKTADGVVMRINRGQSGGRRKCKFCTRTYGEGKLCDFPIGNGRTCDAEMCNYCATTIRGQETDLGGGMKKLNGTFDVCPIHKGIYVLNSRGREKGVVNALAANNRRVGEGREVSIISRISHASRDLWL